MEFAVFCVRPLGEANVDLVLNFFTTSGKKKINLHIVCSQTDGRCEGQGFDRTTGFGLNLALTFASTSDPFKVDYSEHSHCKQMHGPIAMAVWNMHYVKDTKGQSIAHHHHLSSQKCLKLSHRHPEIHLETFQF